ncbi:MULTISPECIES: NleF caspase inhibitor [Yersinia pseudotuberculosis complex]|uniref:Uncharacterized protein n=1 Tax=Yersinia pseudotuberculosis serotype O:1b (strain IP 31758) TaxID=349747 RepID=A0A0U1QZP4_YERP3|nr:MULTISPECIES: NleF caspase inhibitor [Yersinia pseudotuberculosis complex]ABS48285.1 conserved hypothetical protein [Yersinia pseudotuberculosis IP 31758]MCE4111185.1 hypothetical protein [Yersinia pseudotuberculosis]MCF1162585.1 hypothetical protein [Yersinia pseudotuberculosis]RYC25584.1 hypothetical protein EU971_13815 [Yersinia pseudotuberculosis]UFA61161.1 NleF caspase inhibitor [Yersinia pseudotuberculosis]
MPGRIQPMPQSWLTASRPAAESVKQPSTGLVKDSSLNKDIKTASTEAFLEKVDAWMLVICARKMDGAIVEECINELSNKMDALYKELSDTRNQVYKLVPNDGRGGGRIAQLREGYDATDREHYLEKLIAYNQIKQVISDEIEYTPKKYADSIERIVDLHHSGSIYGDLMALNKNSDVPNLGYNLGRIQFG